MDSAWDLESAEEVFKDRLDNTTTFDNEVKDAMINMLDNMKDHVSATNPPTVIILVVEYCGH